MSKKAIAIALLITAGVILPGIIMQMIMGTLIKYALIGCSIAIPIGYIYYKFFKWIVESERSERLIVRSAHFNYSQPFPSIRSFRPFYYLHRN